MEDTKKAIIAELEIERNALKVASEGTDKDTKYGEGLAAGLRIAATILEGRIKELREA